jgi:ubiquitin-conjugating enzyme E2 C
MVAGASSRLQKELMDLMMGGAEGISAFPHNDDLFHWIGSIMGAEGTPYEGLEYQLSIKFPEQYPFEAPHVAFLTPCFHPNVDVKGSICLDILKEKWSAIYTASQVLLSIQSLLDNPNNESPLNSHAAALWANRAEFCRVVKSTFESKSSLA